MLKSLACLLVLASLSTGCGGEQGSQRAGGTPAGTAQGGGTALTGAGATFPAPLYTKWFDAYARETGVRINYQSIGSGGGIRQSGQELGIRQAVDGPIGGRRRRRDPVGESDHT